MQRLGLMVHVVINTCGGMCMRLTSLRGGSGDMCSDHELNLQGSRRRRRRYSQWNPAGHRISLLWHTMGHLQSESGVQ